MPETVLNLSNGWSLRSDDGDNVRLCEPDGTERIYWDQNEWHEDPVGVMAAIFGAATILPADNPDSVKLELAKLEAEFEAVGGRGVELADRIDALRAQVHGDTLRPATAEEQDAYHSGNRTFPGAVETENGLLVQDDDGPATGSLPADVERRLNRFKKEHPDLVLDPTKEPKTWTYSQVNPGGADITHGLTFTGTDDEWAEHLVVLTYQGIEPYNAKITAP